MGNTQQANNTGSNNTISYDGKLVWITGEACLSFMTVVLIYICCCLIRTVVLSRKTSTGIGDTGGRNNASKSVRSTIGNSEIAEKRKKLREYMRYACLFAACTTLTKVLVDQLKFLYAWNANWNTLCEILYDVTDVAIFGMAFVGIYAFLWIKQWLFYCDPVAVKFLYSRKLVYFNRVFIAVMLVLGVACMIWNWIPVRYEASNHTGCIAVYDMRDPHIHWPLITYAALNTTFQFTLMGLFVYPLVWDRINKWKHSRASKQTVKSVAGQLIQRQFPDNQGYRSSPVSLTKFPHDDSVSVDSKADSVVLGRKHVTATGNSLSKKAVSSIRRTILWTSVCIVTDLTLVVVFAVCSIGTPQVLVAIATDFDLLLNVICIIATYTNWKQILFPMFAEKEPLLNGSSARYLSHDLA